MNIKKSVFSAQPNIVTPEGATVLVTFDVEKKVITPETQENNEATAAAEPITQFEAYAVRLAHPLTRSRRIDAIVTAAYPSDVMQAIINNHLLDPTDEVHEAEFNEMQAWRKHAKEVADHVLNPIG